MSWFSDISNPESITAIVTAIVTVITSVAEIIRRKKKLSIEDVQLILTDLFRSQQKKKRKNKTKE